MINIYFSLFWRLEVCDQDISMVEVLVIAFLLI